MVYYPTRTGQSPWPRPPWHAGAAAAGAGLMSYNRFYRGGPKASQYRTGSTNNMVVARSAKRRRTSFKSKMVSVEPAKHWSFEDDQIMVQNTIYTITLTAGVGQGVGAFQRLGDSIELAALKIKGVYSTAAVTGAYTFRIMIGWTGEEYNLPTVFGIGLVSADIFLPNTYNNYVTSGINNPKGFTMLYDETIDVNSIIATAAEVNSFAFTVPLNQSFYYQSNAGTFGKTRNLSVAIVATAIGAAGGTIVGTCDLSYDLIYK